MLIKYIYSGDKNFLAQIIDSRNNPGTVEIDYVRQFELPWREYRTKHNPSIF